MKPRISLRQSLQYPNLLGGALSGDSRNGRIPSLKTSARHSERSPAAVASRARVDQFAAVIGRRGGKSRAMKLATYIAGLCDHSDAFIEIPNAVEPVASPLLAARSSLLRHHMRDAAFCRNSFKRHYGPDGDPLVLVAIARLAR